MKFETCRIPATATIEDAMRSLHRSGAEIALVVDPADRLLGTVTDGDVRRALLGGGTLQSPVANHMWRDFVAVGPEAGRAEVLDIMQARTLSGIPIIEAGGRLIGLHLIHEILGAERRANCAVVMAGGKGARLWPLTENLPKPMLRVAGRPILERIVLHLVSCGIQRVFISVNYLGNVIEQHFGDGSRLGCQIEYLREDKPLGTGGALSLMPELPSLPLVVMNGDLVTQANIGLMLDFHARVRPKATIAVRPYSHVVPFGCVELEGAQVRQLEEKPRLTKLVNAGIYVIEPELVLRVPRGEEYFVTDLFANCLERGEPVAAFEIEGDWIDVGQRESLRQANGREA
ncbi:MAG: nucleotidyltransferase family protein [Vicinamibacteria bacterium]